MKSFINININDIIPVRHIQTFYFIGQSIYETNTFKNFDYGVMSFNFGNGNIKTGKISFSGTFGKVPQVILTFVKYNMNQPQDVKFSITSVTFTDFSVLIICPSLRVFRYQVYWHAIDDLRREVINCFNQIPTLTKTISHSNPNALYGFLTITSFYMTGSTNFILTISSITATSVTVDLSSITNLSQIGYQIILGVDSSFGSSILKSLTSAYTSPSLRIEKNKYFLSPLCGFNFNNQDNIRIQKLFTISGDNLVYSISQWSGIFIPSFHLEIQIPYDYITISKALKQITAYKKIFSTQSSNFQVTIQETNQIYENLGTFKAEIIDTISTVNINVLIKCTKNNKITAKLNYCGTCTNQGRYEQQRSCYGSINRYKFRNRFQSTFLAKKYLTITITQQSFLITQLVYTEDQISVQTQLNIIQMSLLNT